MQLLPMILYTIQRTGNENTQTYQMEVAIFNWRQILESYLKENLQQLEGRINN